MKSRAMVTWPRLEAMLKALALCTAAVATFGPSVFAGPAPYTAEERPPAPADTSIPVSAAEKAKLLRGAAGGAVPAVKRQLPPPRKPVAGASLPPPESLRTMVQGAIIAIHQANFTGDYTVLHALGTRELQERTTPSALAKAFKPLRDQKIDLYPVLLLPVGFTEPPGVRSDGMLRLAGYFPSRLQQVNFVIVYYPVAGYWRIDGLSVSTSPAGAAGPVASAPASQMMARGLVSQETAASERPH
jgi:hypothetical protein